MTNMIMVYGLGAAMLIGGATIGVAVVDHHAPITSTACVQGVCATVTTSKAEMLETCRALAESPLIVQLGGVKADSPCGKLMNH